MQCPNCKITDNKVGDTRLHFFKDVEYRLRERYCKACGVTFRTYEVTFKTNENIGKIAEVLEGITTFYPPVIRPYRWKQKEALF